MATNQIGVEKPPFDVSTLYRAVPSLKKPFL